MSESNTNDWLGVIGKIFEKNRREEQEYEQRITDELGTPHYETPAYEDEDSLCYWNTAHGVICFRRKRNGLIDPRSRVLYSKEQLALLDKIRAMPVDERFT